MDDLTHTLSLSATAQAWEGKIDAFRSGSMGAAELACHYVLHQSLQAHGKRTIDGARNPPLVCRSERPVVRLFAERRLHRLPAAVARALVAWADGARSVELLFDIPTARDVVALQARGRRCVSLLPSGVPTAPHADSLAFAVHDLCHLEKLACADHYAGQVGFFAAVETALEHGAMTALDARLDASWPAERDSVLADMNGSPVFLFLVLKSRLRIAVRKRFARGRGAASCADEPLHPAEAMAIDEACELLYGALAIHGHARDAARALANKDDRKDAQAAVQMHFERLGRDRLGA